MKYKEISAMNADALKKELAELRGKAADLKRKMRLGQVKNVRELATVRKDIARILTFMRAN